MIMRKNLLKRKKKPRLMTLKSKEFKTISRS